MVFVDCIKALGFIGCSHVYISKHICILDFLVRKLVRIVFMGHYLI